MANNWKMVIGYNGTLFIIKNSDLETNGTENVFSKY